jgi:hypothetical protein
MQVYGKSIVNFSPAVCVSVCFLDLTNRRNGSTVLDVNWFVVTWAGYKPIKVEKARTELTKALLVKEDDRLMQDVEEGNLVDPNVAVVEVREYPSRPPNNGAPILVQSTVLSAEESLDELTSSLINEIATHRLEVHLDQVAQKLRNAHHAIISEARALLVDVTATANEVKHMECTPSNKIDEFHSRAEDIQQKLLQLTKVATKKALELQSTSGSQSGSDGSSLSPIVEAKLAKYPWTTCIGGGGGAVLTLLSDIYLSIRTVEHGGQDDEEVWVAPQAFERATQKYWVKEEDLTQVMLACVAELPLLVYGK